MSDSILDVRNLHVHFDVYEGTSEVINGVDLKVDQGEKVTIVGETGCGKSVTVKTILGLLEGGRVPEGEILYGDTDIIKNPKYAEHIRGSEVGMITQDPMSSLNPVFKIGEQMMDVLRWQNKDKVNLRDYIKRKFSDESDLRERCIQMLKEVELAAPERVFESYPVELSGGMRQRVLIAVALLTEPNLLIADEPGTALDVTTESKILELLDDLVEDYNTSILYITHDLGVAREISDTINVMYAGNIVENGPADELFENPQHPYTRGLLESVPKLSEKMGSGIDGFLPEYVNPPEGCRFADRCEYSEPECTEVFPHSRMTSENHSVGCHLYEGTSKHSRHRESAMAQDVDIGEPPWHNESSIHSGGQK
jgi:peptide/nickel transport system ATP-binding protein